MRAMGIDFGMRRVGIALSDPLRILASRHSTLTWNGKDIDTLLKRIFLLADEMQVDTIVLGYPLRTDGAKSAMTKLTEHFAERLREGACKLVLLDERYTSIMAREILQESGQGKSRDKGLIDRVSAEILLQEYLENERDSVS